jgi:hypothetical protein
MPSLRAILASAVVCAVFGLVLALPAGAKYSPHSALGDLNQMRSATGMAPVSKISPRWNRGCRLHNRYMRRTGQFGHFERRSSRYYTRLGAAAAKRSVIAAPAKLPSAAFGDTVYHRMAMLNPRLRSIGFASHYGFTCMQVIGGVKNNGSTRASSVSVFPWPANNSQGADPSFDDVEFPDPRADAPGATELGTPLTINFNGPWAHWEMVSSSVSSASMTDELGQVVPVSAADSNSANGVYMQGGIAILPRRPLAENSWHTVTASGSLKYRDRSYPFSFTTSFRTGEDR